MDWQVIALVGFMALGFVAALLGRRYVSRRRIAKDADQMVDDRTRAWIRQELQRYHGMSDKEALREFRRNFGEGDNDGG